MVVPSTDALALLGTAMLVSSLLMNIIIISEKGWV